MTHRCWPPLGSASETPARKEQRDPWPKLKALYLRKVDQDWLQRLPKFEELQILSLQLASGIPAIDQSAIKEIAKCRCLRVIDLGIHEFEDVEALLAIAHGCPLLRKFRVPFVGPRELEESLFLDLLRALPCLEFLELGLKFRMDGATLQELARRCPRLTVLELFQTRLCLSLAQMGNVCPFPQLEILRVKEVWFENPRRLMQHRKIQNIATEWRRIFPKLRDMPCPADIYSRYMVEDDLSEEPEDTASVSADEEMLPREPGLDFKDYGSDW